MGRGRIAAALSALAAVLVLVRPAGATTAADICSPTADPCNLTTDVTVTDGSTLDFGNRALVVGRFKHLDAGGGTMTVLARSVEVQPGGGILAATGANGGVVDITTTGGLRIDQDGSTLGRIDVSGGTQAGDVHVTSGGDVVIDGALLSTGSTINGSGGLLDFTVHGNVTLVGTVSVAGGAQGGGGSMSFIADGTITVSDSLDGSGGELDGGDIDLEAGGDLLTTTSSAKLDVNGGGLSGSGGTVTLVAGGSVSLAGPITGLPAGSTSEGGGDGAEVDITAQQGVTLGGQVTVTGAAPDGGGGNVCVDAGTDVVQQQPVLAGGVGIDACGGCVDWTAGRNMSLNAIDATGGSCGGGDVCAVAGATVTAPMLIDTDGSSTGTGGTVMLGGQIVSVSGNLRGSGGAGGGTVTLQGCTVGITSSSQLTTQGSAGENLLQASGQMTVTGTLVAGATNRLEYLDPGKPPQLAGSSITPPPQVVVNSALPPCQQAVCGDGTVEPGEECDDGNTTACDGCSASCQVERCGNGVVECAEQCDDGALNGTPGDSCDATCHAVPITVRFLPGAPKTRGCLLEWAIENPGSGLSHGFPVRLQTCIDGDPACDADGANDGGCTFTVSACLNLQDTRLPACQSHGVKGSNLHRPSPVRPADDVERQNAATFVDALEGLGITVQSGTTVLGSGTTDSRENDCTARLGFRVPHAPGHVGRRILSASALDPSNHNMRSNRVRFACLPNPAVCGNGKVELGEQCDDGNTTPCDGCSATCRIERCGNGVVECNEQCDDGPSNGQPGDPCSASCTEVPPALRIPGGGPPTTDCALEWSLAIAQPTLDRHGIPFHKQTCVDGDPACDFDAAPGQCRFHLWACVGGDDTRIGCAASTVTGVDVVRPSASQTGPPARARQALLAALPGIGFPAGPGERCTARIDVDVSAGRRALVLGARAHRASGPSDGDLLQLLCAPAPAP